MKSFKRLNLQLFAEGAGDGSASGSGAGEGAVQATTGVNATAAAEQKLRELGVPEDKIRKRASKYASRMPMPTESAPVETEDTKKADEVVSAPTEDNNPTDEKVANNTTKRMTWDEIMADPEYNQQMQSLMSKRLKSAKIAEDNLAKLTPAMELLARKYKLDPSNMDYEALNKAIEDDDEYYEDKALEMGVSNETARRIDKLERDNAREKAQAERTAQEQQIQQHFQRLEEQGAELKKTFPGFDLKTELKNPAFARMTAPNIGISVADAYYAVHRDEIRMAESQVIAQKTAEKMSNAVQAGSRRPSELGTSSQAPSVNTFDYRKATPEQRAELKRRIFAAAANGEKVYPGQ
jgi:hypothetical protein